MAVATATAFPAAAQQAASYSPEQSPRFALLIGNSDYNANGAVDPEQATDGHLRDLKNACGDAELIAARLGLLNWKDEDIVVKCDLTKQEIDLEIDRFADRYSAAQSPTAILYFAGHGIQINDHNYVFGTGVTPNAVRAAAALALNPRAKPFAADAEEIVQYLSTNVGAVVSGALLVVVDACRENPLIPLLKDKPKVSSVSGPKPFTPPLGIVTAYSTSNGKLADDGVGENSPFATALNAHMRAGVSIETILNETATELYDRTADLPNEQQPSKLGNFREPPVPCLTECVPANAWLDGGKMKLAIAGNSDWLTLLADLQQAPREADEAPRIVGEAPREDDSAPRAVDVEPSNGGNTTVRPEQIRSPTRTVYERLSNEPDRDAVAKIYADVFWCDGDAMADVRRIRASEFAAALATFGRFNKDGAHGVLERVRVRQLTAAVNATPDYMIKGDVIRYQPAIANEEAWANIARDVSYSALKLEEQPRGTENVLDIFICSSVSIDTRPSRVYVQIADVAQQQGTTAAITELKKDVPGLAVAGGLDLQEKASPDATEVRFFHQEDAPTAVAVANRLSAITQERVTAKKLDYEKVLPGTLEVWVGKNSAVGKAKDNE
jgi:hypothetical protein